jgi:FKBP-type peptidyl-prolyl cis-trans isomerase
MNVGNKLRYAKDILDTDALFLGILDVLYGEPLITQERSFILRQEFNEARMQATDRERAAEGEKNMAAGMAFLAENAKREGVITTETGLQYEVLAEGQGPSPGLKDEVAVDCRKMYVDGTEFESSDNFGKPYVFRVDTAIAGWQEGLLKMKVGSKYRLYIPQELGFGPVGMGWLIGPYATLIYEVELLEIRKAPGSGQ